MDKNEEAQRLIAQLYQDPAQAAEWMDRPHTLLDGLTPAQYIESGKDLMPLVRQIMGGLAV